MYKKVGHVFSTKKYDMFKKLKGNRDVFDKRKSTIMSSIEERGWIRNPIVVNEKMEIIDGQGRFEALKELDMSIEYVISKGATIDDCVALNVKQKNWSFEDYVRCYAQIGNEHYIRLQEYMNKYKDLANSTLCCLIGKSNQKGGCLSEDLKNGRFEIYDPGSVDDRLYFFQKCYEIIGKNNGRSTNWAVIIKFIFFCEKLDNEFFLSRLSKYRAFIYPCVNKKQCIECLEKVYNYTRKKSYVYFMPEYDEYMRRLRVESRHNVR